LSPILDIKKFLNVRGFCNTCQKAFVKKNSYETHKCKTNVNYDVSKPSEEEPDLAKILLNKLRKDTRRFLGKRFKSKKDINKGTRYIIWDIETRQDLDAEGHRYHVPNLIVAYEIIIYHKTTDNVEEFVDNLIPHVFKGPDCLSEYCEWAMAEESNVVQRKKGLGYEKKQSV
jgi:hypothetical protein